MNFGDSVLNCFRRAVGKSFRKSLGVYNYKIGHQQYHKQPGVIPLHLKEKLRKVFFLSQKHRHLMFLALLFIRIDQCKQKIDSRN